MNDKIKANLIKIREEFLADRLGATREEGGCVYEAEDGKHCAIGCLISQEKLDEIKGIGMNADSTADELFRQFPEIKESLGLEDDQAIALQNWHDGAFGKSAVITKEAFSRMLNGLIGGWYTEIIYNPDPFLLNPVKVSFL